MADGKKRERAEIHGFYRSIATAIESTRNHNHRLKNSAILNYLIQHGIIVASKIDGFFLNKYWLNINNY